MRFKVDVFVSEKVLDEAGIVPEDESNKEEIISSEKKKSYRDMSIKELNKSNIVFRP